MDNGLRGITVTLPDGTQKSVVGGVSLLELSRDFKHGFSSEIIAGKVDNEIKELSYKLDRNCKVEFIDLRNSDGIRIYQRSLTFVLIKAVNDLFPERKFELHHSLSNQGLYCEIIGNGPLKQKEILLIEMKMREITEASIPFIKKVIPKELAREKFEREGRIDRYKAIEHRLKSEVTIYECGGFEDYFYGYMAPDTGYVKKFKLISYNPGLILMHPQKNDPDTIPDFEEQKQLFNIFEEYKNWGRILEIENIGALNDMVVNGKINEVIRISEALHEKKYANVADLISNSKPRKKVVFISGPSSSGKTTSAKRLSIQLKINGLKPVAISIDDYYLPKSQIPLGEDGKPDLEAVEAFDVELFREHILKIVNEEEISVPIYDFKIGGRLPESRKITAEDNQVVIVEGIHGLNDKLTKSVPDYLKFGVYISALTSMNIDDHNRVPSTDTRLLRRIVRDNQYRGASALDTLRMWPSVRNGEKKYIFPFQEQADAMLNSFLIYEWGVLKKFAEPLLKEIDRSYPEYSEAKRLLELLSYFLPVEYGEIPVTSILREFIGGSCYS